MEKHAAGQGKFVPVTLPPDPPAKNAAPRAASYHQVVSRSALRELAGRLAGAGEVAVDLEADSMYHFQEKVCLVQLATDEGIYLVDPLAIGDIDELRDFFAARSIRKVLHGADYDVRSLYRDFGIKIGNLFDTQIAAAFLGWESTGLEALLRDCFGIAVDKKYQKKDWSQRPLPEAMLGYAAEDVHYLLPLAHHLESALASVGRRGWVLEECAAQSRVRPSADESGPLFTHVKGAGRLKPRSLAALEAMLRLRSAVARHKDRPLFKIIGNRTLLQIAQRLPRSRKQLEAMQVLSKTQLSMYGHELLSEVQRARALPAGALPAYPHRRVRSTPLVETRRRKALKRWRQMRADELGLAPGLLCSRALINELARRRPRSERDLETVDVMKAWQREAFGGEIIAVLADTG